MTMANNPGILDRNQWVNMLPQCTYMSWSCSIKHCNSELISPSSHCAVLMHTRTNLPPAENTAHKLWVPWKSWQIWTQTKSEWRTNPTAKAAHKAHQNPQQRSIPNGCKISPQMPQQCLPKFSLNKLKITCQCGNQSTTKYGEKHAHTITNSWKNFASLLDSW